MTQPSVLLAGASGRLGLHILHSLSGLHLPTRALSRSAKRIPTLPFVESAAADLTQPASLHGLCSGIDTVISCAGASTVLGAWRDKDSFERVDYAGNVALLFEARRARVRRFIYVSLANALALRSSAYARAHERFAFNLEASGLESVIVRPTGFFSFFTQLIPMARLGALFLPGDGRSRTNPIHEAGVARACIEALHTNQPEIAVGGPEIFTRHRITEIVFDSLRKTPRIVSLPPPAFQPALAASRLFHPRLHDLIEFGLAVSSADVIAPAYGHERLGDYLRAFVNRAQPA